MKRSSFSMQSVLKALLSPLVLPRQEYGSACCQVSRDILPSECSRWWILLLCLHTICRCSTTSPSSSHSCIRWKRCSGSGSSWLSWYIDVYVPRHSHTSLWNTTFPLRFLIIICQPVAMSCFYEHCSGTPRPTCVCFRETSEYPPSELFFLQWLSCALIMTVLFRTMKSIIPPTVLTPLFDCTY